MKRYYVIADLKRKPSGGEAHGIPGGGQMHAGKIKAVVWAETAKEACDIGKKIITGSLRKGLEPFNWFWNEVDFLERNGDREIYEQYPTATWISFYRVQKGFTQQQLANAAGVNTRLIQKLEGGETKAGNVTARNLLAIADALGVDPHALI